MDYAEPKYGKQLITDIKSVLKILLLFVPLPLFWALFDQQGSRWTFQATRMNGNLGFMEIKPDQMQVINPLLILVFIPIFDCAIYPFMAKFGLKRPLQKLTVGGILAGVAFLISGLVELQLEKTYPKFPKPNESQIRIFNGNPCNYEIVSTLNGINDLKLEPLNLWRHSLIANGNQTNTISFTSLTPQCAMLKSDLNLKSGTSNSFFIHGGAESPKLLEYEEKIEKSKSGNPFLKVLANLKSFNEIKFESKSSDESMTISVASTEQFEILPGTYKVSADGIKIDDVELLLGGVYTLVVNGNSSDNLKLKTHLITSPNSFHMLWLIPQYIIMTAGEVMFSVTGLEFAYSQAPSSMKSLLQACWLLTVAFGNVIVVVIAEAKFFQSQAYEFFLFTILMFVDMAIFSLLALKYKYVINKEKHDDEDAIPIEDTDTRKTFTNNAFQED